MGVREYGLNGKEKRSGSESGKKEIVERMSERYSLFSFAVSFGKCRVSFAV